MSTDPPSNGLSGLGHDFKFCDADFLPNFDQSHPADHLDIVPLSNVSWQMDFMNNPEPDPVLQYINQLLLEENVEVEPGMLQDPLTLKSSEKSFSDVLDKDSSSHSSHQSPICIEKNAGLQDSSSFESSTGHSAASKTDGSISADPQWIFDHDPGKYELSLSKDSPIGHTFHRSLQAWVPRQLNSFRSIHDTNTNVQMNAFARPNTIPNIFSDSESILLFQRGMEEGSKFLPSVNLIGDSAKTDILTSELVVNVEKYETDELFVGSRGRKHRQRDETELSYQRSSKQSATSVSVQEDELSEKFDRVLLKHVPPKDFTFDNISCKMPGARESRSLNGGRITAKKSVIDTEAPDLSALLMSCAQSIAADDRKTATEQLKLIKQYASPIGDPYQRVAILFANALEARLLGTGPENYKALTSKKIPATEELKAYRVYHITPFKAIPVLFGNQMILERASKASTLHIIDFGIGYGFQWPSIIQHLSARPGGPPKLRITGIEVPQPGFRPAAGVEETGCRLARYCKRFYVPFEYRAIATRNWETIREEDLKVTRGEVLVVNCQFRFKHLLDETLEEDSPKDVVLNLIRNLNPDVFLSDNPNGSYGGPFFLTRFRESLYFFSSLFDAIDNNLPRHDEQRLKFEQKFFGAQIMNVVACEGRERFERPETYKQWQMRYTRTGFKPLPLKQDLMTELRGKVKANYHKDFVFDEDGSWMLLGWRGKILTASSCWVPA